MMSKFQITLCMLCLLLGISSTSFASDEIDKIIQRELTRLKEIYIDLHQTPELSLYEKETSKKLANELRKLNFEVTEGFGGYGVVGIFKNGDGPVILYRTDMDALPMEEKTGLPYASTVQVVDEKSGEKVGVTHSCGHDMHMTVWIGTAKAMVAMKDQWKGTLMMIGQPAEEIGAGADLMLKAGLYEKFYVPDYGIGLHVSPTIAAGKVGFGKGYTMANTESIDITIYGQGAHGAVPHKSIDPIVTAAMIIVELQTITSRNLNPLDAAVVTVGAIKGGTKHNIIPDEVKLQLTVRTYTEEVRLLVHRRIKEICQGIAMSMGLPEEKYPTVHIPSQYTPANYNDPDLTGRMIDFAAQTIGIENIEQADPQMVGEDFSRYGRTELKVPTTFFWLGTVPEERMKKVKEEDYQLPGLHSPFYYPDPELSIVTGVKITTNALIELMNSKKSKN